MATTATRRKNKKQPTVNVFAEMPLSRLIQYVVARSIAKRVGRTLGGLIDDLTKAKQAADQFGTDDVFDAWGGGDMRPHRELSEWIEQMSFGEVMMSVGTWAIADYIGNAIQAAEQLATIVGRDFPMVMLLESIE